MKILISSINEYLKKLNTIEFAVLFGSFAEARQTDISDIDIGIFFAKEPLILELGKIASDLENIADRKIDIVILNDLYINDSSFAYEIISGAKVLLLKNESMFLEYKRRVFMEFIDTRELREKVNSDFLSRLNNNFGKRNYAQ